MSEVESKPVSSVNHNSENQGFLSNLFSVLFFLAIVLSVLWNWDGFWQTDVGFLKDFQKSFFSAKYSEEQLKISRIRKNNEVLDEIESKLRAYESKSIAALERSNLAMDKASLRAVKAEKRLAEYIASENLKCRYYDASLRMIDHLTKKYSEDELARTISCTSKECEVILESKSDALSVCENS